MKRYPFPKNKVLVSGHRGDRSHGDENTMRAFRRAVEIGVDIIETDVRMTRDGKLVLMHDGTIDRTTNGHGKISEMLLDELRGLNSAANAADTVEPEAVPLLSEFLNFAKEYPSLLLNVELKDDPCDCGDFAYECADKVCRMLIDYGVDERTWIVSFSGKLLEYVYKKYGNRFFYHGFYPWFILGEMSTDPEEFIDVACMQHRYLDECGRVVKYEEPLCPKEWFDYLNEKGIVPLSAPSLKETDKYDLTVKWGAKIICHDAPEQMLEHLRKMGLH